MKMRIYQFSVFMCILREAQEESIKKICDPYDFNMLFTTCVFSPDWECVLPSHRCGIHHLKSARWTCMEPPFEPLL